MGQSQGSMTSLVCGWYSPTGATSTLYCVLYVSRENVGHGANPQRKIIATNSQRDVRTERANKNKGKVTEQYL